MSQPPSFTVRPGDVVGEPGVLVPRRLCGPFALAADLADFAQREGRRSPVFALLVTAFVAEGLAHSRQEQDTPPARAGRFSRGLSTTQAARALGTSPRTVQRLVLDGRLPATLVGCRWAIDPLDLEDYRAARAAA